MYTLDYYCEFPKALKRIVNQQNFREVRTFCQSSLVKMLFLVLGLELGLGVRFRLRVW
jgi:hypothetical protein